MNVSTAPVTARATSAPKFNYNPQDPETLPKDSVPVDQLNINGGKLSTDSVLLENKKAIFFMGNLVGFRPDPGYKLQPDAEGNFTYDQSNPLATGSNVFGATAQTIKRYNEEYAKLTGKNFEWAFGKEQLKVSPETGNWPNAFYARQMEGTHFFDHKTTSTGDSGEVVSHETGHAILDAVRPGYLSGSGTETGAFHEAFGDILAILMTLENDQALDAVVAQTDGGDLSSKRNMVSDMGEAFGKAVGKEGGIRTALNKFVYQDPATLPEHGDQDNLGREIHDFSRLWTGTFYDVLDGISDAHRAAGMSPKEALRAAGAEGWKLLIGQMENTPNASETTFKEMGTALLAGDAQFNGSSRNQLITDVLTRRELLNRSTVLGDLSQPRFTGLVEPREFVFGEESGKLAGVKMTSFVDQSALGFADSGDSVTLEAERGARMMLADNDILFTGKTPTLEQMFKPDGDVYRAYVAPNANGEMEFVKVPMAMCNFSHGPDQGHIHGPGCNH
jgi:hypothetical protein